MAQRTSKPVPRDPATTPAKDSSGAGWNPLEWCKSILDFVTKNLPQIPKKQRTFVLLAALGCVLAFAGSIMLFRRGQDIFGGGLLLATLALFACAMLCARQPSVISAQPESLARTRKSPTPDWSRVTVKVRIGETLPSKLAEQVRTVRSLAQGTYSELLGKRTSPPSQTDPDDVRVNVFLPDTGHVRDGEVCALFIPPDLHDGMKNKDERGIKFRPNEGVTGRVFTRQEPIGTRRTSATEEWQWIYLEGSARMGDGEFQLTQSQMQQIDKDLRWIVSFPLMGDVTGKQNTVGVLNVDGLSEVLTPAEMQVIYSTLKPEVGRFAECLAGLDKCRITIAVEDV
jgi:hypothetical protein